MSCPQGASYKRRAQPLLLATLFASFVLVLACSVFEPRWETNDDVAMAMAAHGFGVASHGVPTLVFSQVIWGYIVRALPSVAGLHGYSVAVLLCLFMVGWTVSWCLLKAGCHPVLAIGAVLLVMARPVLFPQFTLTAGLLCVAAVLLWLQYARTRTWWCLLAGCVLAYSGYLVRAYEFALVMAVALPSLPLRQLYKDRPMQLTMTILVVAIGLSAAIEKHVYDSEEWMAFHELNFVRGAFTDFELGNRVKQMPAVMQRYGYSPNDIDLLSRWFFVDSAMAKPAALKGILADVGFVPNPEHGFQQAGVALARLFSSHILPLLLAALVGIFWAPMRWQLIWLCVMTLGAVAVFGYLGRAGVLRPFFPLVTLFFLWPLAHLEGWRVWLQWITVLTACVVNLYILLPEARAAQDVVKYARDDIQHMQPQLIVTWGGAFPYESIFPLLEHPQLEPPLRLYAMGVFNLAPFSVARAEELNGQGMISRLLQPEGVAIVSQPIHMVLLEKYCSEHHGGSLRTLSSQRMKTMTIQIVRCEAGADIAGNGPLDP